jgi:sugar phosphate isomerase/epimerase
MTADRPASMDRRRFLRAAGLAAGAAAVVGGQPLRAAASMCSSTVPEDRIGIQLYTCTVATAVARGQTLQGLASLGYRVVEHAGYGSDPAGFRAQLDAAGLRCISGHSALGRPWDGDRVRQLIEDALVIGQRYIVWPAEGSASRVEDWIEVADVMNRAGRLAHEAGMGRFAVGFHNHAVEYQPIAGDPQRRRPIDILMRYCDRRFTHQQMDIGWCWSASDPVLELHRFPGRYRQLHVKDAAGIPHGYRSAPVTGTRLAGPTGAGGPVLPGAGMVDFRSVFAAAKESRQPIDSFLVENDGSVASCFDAAVAGYELLSGMEYEHACRPARGRTS